MNVSVTLQFANAAEAAAALAKLAGPGVIAIEDRPDVGVVIGPTVNQTVQLAADASQSFAQAPAPQLDARAVFGGAAAAGSPTVPAAPGQPQVTAVPQAPTANVPTPPSAGTVPTGAPAASGLVLDSEGLPWDSRIHTEARSTNKDGTWRAKRGLNDEAKVKAIKAELLAAVAAGTAAAPAVPTPPAAAAPASVPPVPTPDPAPTVPVPPVAGSTGVPVPPPTTAQSPAAAPVQQTPKAYHELVMLVNPALSDNRITEAQVAAMLQSFPGVTGIPSLATRPELWTQAYYMFAAMLGVQ